MTEVPLSATRHAPRSLSDLVEGFWFTQLLGTAVALGLPDQLANGPRTYEEIARDCGSDASSILRVLRALQTVGVCRAVSKIEFELTARGQILRTNVPGSISGRATFTSGIMWDLYGQLRAVVKSGVSLPAGRGGFDQLADHPGLSGMHWAMVESSIQAIENAVRVHDFGQYSRVLDVGGGYGGALATLLQRHSAMTGAVLDLGYLSKDAETYLSKRGIGDRAQFISGDFFESIPTGYDCYLLKYVIHDWSDSDALQILRKCASAVGDNAHVLLLERVMPDILEEVPHHQAIAQIDLAMMTTGGKERTEAEYHALLSSAGLRMTAVVATESPCSIIHAISESRK